LVAFVSLLPFLSEKSGCLDYLALAHGSVVRVFAS